ncbi:MAG: M16 family metallopeptidase, partial [Calditrichaceae bacterium]
VYVLEVRPFPEFSTKESIVSREALPETGAPPVAKFPTLQLGELSNGMKIILAERHSVPVVNFDLMIDAGYASDQFSAPGTAKLAMDMLDEGTKSRSALQISEELAQLGAKISAGSNLDVSFVNLSSLKSNLDKSLAIYADVILNPAFPKDDFNRMQKQMLASIRREKATPVQMALRVFPGLLYGENHAYGNPLTGSGTEESVSSFKTADLESFHKTWFRPNNATLVITGDITMSEIKSKIENLFKNWKPGEVPVKNVNPVEQKTKPVVYIMDRPGALQSIIFAGHVAPPKNNPDEIAIETMNNVLGGTFTSRVNMNLREDKHWAYGAFTFMFDARGQRPFIAYAPVQTNKTKESMVEIEKELKDITGTRPPTMEEFTKNQQSQILELPGKWETVGAVGNSISDIVQYGYPNDYYDTFAMKVRDLNLDQISVAAKKVVHPEGLVWVVVGDRSKIESGIKELGFGEIHMLDADGKIIN